MKGLVCCFIILNELWLTLSRGLSDENRYSVTLAFVGDVSFDGPVKYYKKKGFCSYNDTLKNVAALLRNSDLAIGNLESLYVTQDMLADQVIDIPRLRAEADSVEALKFAGFNVMGLANNHVNDYGERPVNYTISTLKQAGIKAFGINYGTYDAPQTPLIAKVKGIKIGFLGYCTVYHHHPPYHSFFTCNKRRGSLKTGPAIYSDQVATRDVKKLQRKVDVIVVAMHWGTELEMVPNKNQTRQAAHLVSLGVQLVIGCHPHVLQGHVIHGSTITAFSLGNFLFGPSGFSLQSNFVLEQKYDEDDIVREVQKTGTTKKSMWKARISDEQQKDFYYGQLPSKETQLNFEKHVISGRDASLLSRVLRVKINRKGVMNADYIPLQIQFNKKTKCLQPSRTLESHWIKVCGNEDKACLNGRVTRKTN